ncbi:MAG: ATP-binding protein, partial [Planctomycetes bacterium]|nr:ATP-binding protein [Planctomycetota bacterium]
MHREQVIADLEKSNQDLDSFAYIASHDLRAPLRAMNAAIEWLEEDCGDRLTESGAGSLELLRGRVRRMNVLLEDLLDYSRTTRTEYEVEEFDLSEVVHDVIGMCAPRQGIEVRVDVDALRVEARRVPLERVLANLVDNAIKHHDRDQGTIDVRATRCDGGIVLTVSDDGPGIDPAYRAKVFEPFRVLQSRDRIEGSGVGLALVALLVDRCGGSVAIESTAAARGVTFRVGWPASIEASETALAPAGEAS